MIKYKPGDRVIVRLAKDLEAIGTVNYSILKYDTVNVKIDGHSYVVSYYIEDVRPLTQLEAELRGIEQ